MRTWLFQLAKTYSLVLVNTGSLAITTVATSALGFLYWWIATQKFPPAAVGFASATISAMILLANIAVFGWGTLLLNEISRQPGKEFSLISASVILVGAIGSGLGVLFTIVAPFISADFEALRVSIVNIALFAIGTSLTAIALVLEGALIGLWRSDLIFWRSMLLAVIKLAVLFVINPWFWHTEGLTIYATWTIGNAFALAAVAGYVVLKGKRPIRAYLPHWGLLRRLGPAALQHHILNWLLEIPMLVAPMLITALLSAEVNGWYYIAWSIANVASIIPTALVWVGYTKDYTEPTELAHKMRMTLGIGLLACVLANCVLLPGAGFALTLFGQSYAEQATWCLRILALGSFPLIIKNHYIMLYRIWGRVVNAIFPVTIGVFAELGAIALGARLGGLPGLSLGWIIALSVEAAYMFSTVYKVAQLGDVFVLPH
jgi:O-antigen/teichoic acid export membrane protein